MTRFKSSHPHLLGLPVVVPNYCPFYLNFWPIWSLSSERKGPYPTLVVYALTTPITVSILSGLKPNPVDTPPIEVLDDVT